MNPENLIAVPRVVLVAITKHGAAQVAALARELPQAELCVAEKFAPALAGLANPLRVYSGAFKDEIGELFARYDQIVFFVSLGRGGAPDRAASEEQGRGPGRAGGRRCGRVSSSRCSAAMSAAPMPWPSRSRPCCAPRRC